MGGQGERQGFMISKDKELPALDEIMKMADGEIYCQQLSIERTILCLSRP